MSHPVPPYLKNTPFDPVPPAKGSPANKIPPPVTAPFYKSFEGFFLRHQRLSEGLLLGLVGYGIYRWVYSEEIKDARHHKNEQKLHPVPINKT